MATEPTVMEESMQRVADRKQLLEILPRHSVGAELGVFDGDFSRVILEVVQPERLYLVDTWSCPTAMKRETNAGEWEECSLSGPAALEVVSARLHLEIETGQVSLVPMDTREWLRQVPVSALDWVYLDSDHQFEYVRNELVLAYHRVRSGGWIAGHDYCEVFPGVIRAVDEFCVGYGVSIDYLTDELPAPVWPRPAGAPEWCAYNSYAIHILGDGKRKHV